MIRPLYRCVLRLHPSGFRKRFTDEMLSIVDHSAPPVSYQCTPLAQRSGARRTLCWRRRP